MHHGLMLYFRAVLIAVSAAAEGKRWHRPQQKLEAYLWQLRLELRTRSEALCMLQISLLSFRTQFIVAGPGLIPWQA